MKSVELLMIRSSYCITNLIYMNTRNLKILNRIEKQQKLKKRFAYEILAIFFLAYVVANFIFVLMFNLILYVWKKK